MTHSAQTLRGFALKMLLSTVLVVVLVALLNTFYVRYDLTAAKQYSLSSSTQSLIARLDDRLQVKLYFNQDIRGHEYLLPERLLLPHLSSVVISDFDSSVVICCQRLNTSAVI